MATGPEWQSQVGKAWATNASLTDRAFSGLTQRLLERIASVPGDTIMDIGCGAGELSLALARARPASMVTGVDISPDLVDAACQRGVNVSNLKFVLSDASTWQVERGPDLLVSRHGVMFFDDPLAAFAHLHAQSESGANLVFTCFRALELNRWAVEPLELLDIAPAGDPDTPGPFAFASEQRVRSILSRSGWHDVRVDPIDFPFVTGLGEDAVEESLHFFTRIGPSARILRDMEEDARNEAMQKLARWIRLHRDDACVSFPASAWMVTARKS